MAKSEYTFKRWKSQAPRTWSYTLYGKYDFELTRTLAAQFTATKFIYRSLGETEALLTDRPEEKFGFGPNECERSETIKEWSDHYDAFTNWTTLNALLTLASNFETYLASIIKLSLKSDPGILLGTPNVIDGLYIQKYKKRILTKETDVIQSCTKGNWSSRIAAFEFLFGSTPELRTNHSDLEYIRKVRNEVGHAFGRDIDQAQKFGQIKPIPIRKLERILLTV